MPPNTPVATSGAGPQLGMLRVVWFVFMLSPLLCYVALTQMLGPTGGASEMRLVNGSEEIVQARAISLAMSGAAIVLFIVGFFLSRRAAKIGAAGGSFGGWIVSLAMFEAVGLIGFVDAMLGKDASRFPMFAVLALVGMALVFPRKN